MEEDKYDPHSAENELDEVVSEEADRPEFAVPQPSPKPIADPDIDPVPDEYDLGSDDGSTEVRVLLHNSDVSILIGRGGNNIQKLREEQKTIIQMPDSNSIERILSVKGLLCDIRVTLTSVFTLIARDRRNDTSNTECRLLIHQSHAGPLIGHSGEHIREMRNKFMLDIKVFSRRCPLSTDRIVLIKGPIPNIVDCIFDIIQLAKMHPVRGVIQQYDPYNSDEFFAENYGGFVGERRGIRGDPTSFRMSAQHRRPHHHYSSRPPPDELLHMLPYPWGLNQAEDIQHAGVGPIHGSNGRYSQMYPVEGFFDDRPSRMEMFRAPYFNRDYRGIPYPQGPFDEDPSTFASMRPPSPPIDTSHLVPSKRASEASANPTDEEPKPPGFDSQMDPPPETF